MTREILQQVQDHKISVSKAMELLGKEPYGDDSVIDEVRRGIEIAIAKFGYFEGYLSNGNWVDTRAKGVATRTADMLEKVLSALAAEIVAGKRPDGELIFRPTKGDK